MKSQRAGIAPKGSAASQMIPALAAATDRDSAPTHAAIERVARTAYGRLLAIIASSTGDLELAEDCLADAFARALSTWPESGLPDVPERWLVTVARNRGRDVLRSAAHRTAVPLDAASNAMSSIRSIDSVDANAIPDERLAVLFVCGHPAIDARVRTPLMLQAVLGFDARQIAQAFAVLPATMAQRLVRAKRRIRDARIPFAVPSRDRMPERLPHVLEAIYGAWAIDWPLVAGTTMRGVLAPEAHYLAITLAQLLDNEPEAHGLVAMISLSLARVPARGADEFIPLDEQDTMLWDDEMIAQGERHLRRAHALGRVGRFQLEAAIQSVHCARATTGITDWAALRTLYEALVSVAPTLGARVAHAAAIGRLDGYAAGIAALDAIHDPAMGRFQPAWATRAYLLSRAGRVDVAREAYVKAVSLTTDRTVRRYLETLAANLA